MREVFALHMTIDVVSMIVFLYFKGGMDKPMCRPSSAVTLCKKDF